MFAKFYQTQENFANKNPRADLRRENFIA